jgi:hypothetical protein
LHQLPLVSGLLNRPLLSLLLLHPLPNPTHSLGLILGATSSQDVFRDLPRLYSAHASSGSHLPTPAPLPSHCQLHESGRCAGVVCSYVLSILPNAWHIVGAQRLVSLTTEPDFHKLEDAENEMTAPFLACVAVKPWPGCGEKPHST